MKKENQIAVEKKILEEIAKTSSNIMEYKKLCKPISPDNAIGRVSRMDAINNKSVLESTLRRAENKLENLKSIQKKIKTSGFGLCVRCGGAIPTARLIIVPESKKCVKCA